MKSKLYVIHRHVKEQDINHHRTLFAGRGAEWFVDAIDPEHIRLQEMAKSLHTGASPQ